MGAKFFLCGHCKKNLISLRFYHSDKAFKIVDILTLFKTPCNLASFVSLDITINILFAFEGPFCCQYVLICWAFNKFLSSISNERVIFDLHSFFPFASFATPHCFFEAEFILCRAFTCMSNSTKSLRSLRWYMI